MVNFIQLLKTTPYVTTDCKHNNKKDVSIYFMSNLVSVIFTRSHLFLEQLLDSCIIQLLAPLGSTVQIYSNHSELDIKKQWILIIISQSTSVLSSPITSRPVPQPSLHNETMKKILELSLYSQFPQTL